jgi:hypothetical protein
MRCTSWSIQEPSVEAKYFCSLTRKRLELTNLAPAPSAAALTARRRSTFSPMGTAKAFFSIGVRQEVSPAPLTGARRTGSCCSLALALAIATACAAAPATPSLVTWLVAAKPQVPSAITRTPTPYDSVLVRLSTLSSRVTTNWLR